MYNRVAGKIRRLSGSVNGRIFTAAIIVAALASLVKVVSLAKEMLIARIFGAGDALDAFYVAILLPGFLSSIIATSFGSAFVPTYIQVRETEGDLAAQRLFSTVAAFSLAALLGLSLFLAVTAQWLLPVIGSGFGPEKLALTHTLFFVSLGMLLRDRPQHVVAVHVERARVLCPSRSRSDHVSGDHPNRDCALAAPLGGYMHSRWGACLALWANWRSPVTVYGVTAFQSSRAGTVSPDRYGKC